MVITVTGSTGNIGSELVRNLSGAGASVRAILRNPTRAAPTLSGVVWARADLAREDLLDAALAGTTRLFVLTGNQPGFGRIQTGVIRAAERHGVQHVVKLSALGATARSRAPLAREHFEVEEALRESSMTWTMLQPHSFMQNWLGELAASVREERTIRAAIGEGRVPFIDSRDIADVAMEALLHPEEHQGQIYRLTGGRAVGYGELADVLSDVVGERVRYHALSMDEERRRLEERGMAPEAIESMLALAAYQKAGGATERTDDAVERVLGRPPRTIADFARDHRDHFIGN